MKTLFILALSATLSLPVWALPSSSTAQKNPLFPEIPNAFSQTNAQNFKDMVLAFCLRGAYPGTAAEKDAGESASALLSWTELNLGDNGKKIDDLLKQYLGKTYFNPTAGSNAGQKLHWNLLKCLDLYHSAALERLSARFVAHPYRIYSLAHPDFTTLYNRYQNLTHGGRILEAMSLLSSRFAKAEEKRLNHLYPDNWRVKMSEPLAQRSAAFSERLHFSQARRTGTYQITAQDSDKRTFTTVFHFVFERGEWRISGHHTKYRPVHHRR
jgi:hypothetical protein